MKLIAFHDDTLVLPESNPKYLTPCNTIKEVIETKNKTSFTWKFSLRECIWLLITGKIYVIISCHEDCHSLNLKINPPYFK